MRRILLHAWVSLLLACGTPQAQTPRPSAPIASLTPAPSASTPEAKPVSVVAKGDPDLLETYEHKGSPAPRDRERDEALARAMVARADLRWTQRLIQRLAEPMPEPQAPDFMVAWENQLFWQGTAARVLERIQSSEALEPLLGVLLDSRKSILHDRALMALLPLVGTYRRSLQLLREPEHQRTAARLLGALGRSEAAAELVAATRRAQDWRDRFELALALVGLDAPAQTLEAFVASFDRIPADALVNGESARAQLGAAAIGFAAPELVPWLLDRAVRARTQKDASQRTLLLTALNLARPSQLPNVERAIDSFGSWGAQEAVASIHELVSHCQEAVDCYLQAVTAPAARARSDHAAVKAAYMLLVLGAESDAPRVLTALESLQGVDGALLPRLVIVHHFGHLLPHGSATIARGIARLAAQPETAPAEAEELRRLVYRLRAREAAN